MQRGQDLLGCEEPVGDHADEERRHHRRQRRRAVRERRSAARRSFSVCSRYVPIVTYHAPQMKYSRNIITESLIRIVEFILVLAQLSAASCHYVVPELQLGRWSS